MPTVPLNGTSLDGDQAAAYFSNINSSRRLTRSSFVTSYERLNRRLYYRLQAPPKGYFLPLISMTLISHPRSHFSFPPLQIKDLQYFTSRSASSRRSHACSCIKPRSIRFLISKATPYAPINPGSGGTMIGFPEREAMARGTA